MDVLPSDFRIPPQCWLLAGRDGGDMSNILRHGTQRSDGSDGACPAAAASTQWAAGSAIHSSGFSPSTTPAGEQTGDMVSLGQWVMFFVVFIGPLFVIAIYAFLRFEFGQVIEELGASGIRVTGAHSMRGMAGDGTRRSLGDNEPEPHGLLMALDIQG